MLLARKSSDTDVASHTIDKVPVTCTAFKVTCNVQARGQHIMDTAK